MSNALTIDADYKFFDFLAQYRWPDKSKRQLKVYRELVDNGDLDISTVLENALVMCAKGKYKRIAEAYRDFCDNSDAKKSISNFRNNDIARDQWTNSFAISGLEKKTGLIRAVCYSIYQDKFYFFAIPYTAYKGMKRVDVSLDASTGYKDPIGIPKGKWTAYQVETFEELANITEKQAEQLPKFWAAKAHRKAQEELQVVMDRIKKTK
jgi:hypothetical protein